LCRTGRWFGFQHEDIKPDIVTLAKSLGNGVPIGACMASNRAAAPMTPGSHGTTFGGSPLASSAALAVLRFLKDHQMDARAAELGARMLAGFRTNLAGVPGIREIRGRGLMLGIELDRDCAVLVTRAMQRNLLINVTADRVVRLLPPLIMSDAEADHVVTVVSELIREFVREEIP
jgi:acetylornithine aminotransferase